MMKLENSKFPALEEPELFSIFPKVNQKIQESHNQWLDFNICLRHPNPGLSAKL